MVDTTKDIPSGATSWEEAPPEARAAWRRCCQHQSGGDPPPVYTCSGWTFHLGHSGKRYYPARHP